MIYPTSHVTVVMSVDAAGPRLAVLIDGDNAQPSLIEKVLAETAKYGTATIRRIYGDWTSQSMSSWKKHLHSNAIKPIQQFNYTTGKNSTDGALIIDAIDILHSGAVQGFCIVSSDSDYTGLALRMREAGMLVVGIGKLTTPLSFQKACQIFTYTENLSPETKPAVHVPENALPDWKDQVKKAIELSAQEDGWAFLADVGNNVRKTDPAFDPRTYGHKKLLSLIESDSEKFETREHKTDDKPPVYYVRLRSP